MVDNEIHLCDSCGNWESIPECMPSIDSGKIEFDEGVGHDNVIRCSNWSTVNVIAKTKQESVMNPEELAAREHKLDEDYNARKKQIIEENERNRI